jgi:hypothetical protein
MSPPLENEKTETRAAWAPSQLPRIALPHPPTIPLSRSTKVALYLKNFGKQIDRKTVHFTTRLIAPLDQ